MNQNIADHMINVRSKKWWWPLLRFVLDVSVNKAFELYLMRSLDQGEKRLDTLGFRRAFIYAYFRIFCKSATNTTLHNGNRLLQISSDNLRYDSFGH